MQDSEIPAWRNNKTFKTAKTTSSSPMIYRPSKNVRGYTYSVLLFRYVLLGEGIGHYSYTTYNHLLVRLLGTHPGETGSRNMKSHFEAQADGVQIASC